MPLRASDSRRGCRPYTVQLFILSAIGYRYSRDAAARRSHLSQRFCGVGADSRCGRRRETRPHRGVAENAAGRKDGCRRPSGHRERADAGLRAAPRGGLNAGGEPGQDIFPRLEMRPGGTPRTCSGELVQVHDDRATLQASPDKQPVIDTHGL